MTLENREYIKNTLDTENRNFSTSYSIEDNLPDIKLILNFVLKHKLNQSSPVLEKYIALEKAIKDLFFLRGLYDIPIQAYIKTNPLYADLLQVKPSYVYSENYLNCNIFTKFYRLSIFLCI